MATVTIELRKKPNKEGLYPLAVRITVNRRTKYRQFGTPIKKEDWDDVKNLVKASHPNADYLNELITQKLLESRRYLNSLDRNVTNAPVFKSKVKPKNSSNFFTLFQEFLDELEAAENYSRLSTEKGLGSYIKKFHKSKVLSFEDIDESFLKRFRVYLKKRHSLAETSILNIFVLIRSLYNRAISRGLVKKKFYPFGRGKNKVQIKFPETQKIGLSKEEILELEGLTELSPGELHTRNVWLYSFNFAGMRVSDVLMARWSDYRDNRLYYRMSKNSKLLSLNVPPRIKEILAYYEPMKRFPNDFIFPEMKLANLDDPKEIYRMKKTAGKKFNKHLKILAQKAGIEKKLTMHIARHSFGNIAGDSIHPLELQKLYRHSDLKTTLNYQSNFIHADADKALNTVLNF